MRYVKYGFGKAHKVKAKLSIHSINRIKKRLGIKNKYKCKEFINSATKKGILLADIPRIPKYKQFSSYMYSIVKNTKKLKAIDYMKKFPLDTIQSIYIGMHL